jgi:Flp pilus assembly pilin Flp
MSKLNKYRWAKKSCYRGNSLTQYAIIIALIALLLVPVFLILGQNIVNYFAGLDKGLGERKNDHSTVSNDQLPANMTNMAGGSLGGTPDKPVEKCQDNECVIDFGEFVLSGVPENFSDYVRTSGNSGGTKKLVQLLYQMADQLAETGDTDNSLEIKKLATLGHNIALLENEVEKRVIACDRDQTCVQNLLKEVILKPDGYDESYYEFNPNLSYNYMSVMVSAGSVLAYKMDGSSVYEETLKNNSPAALFLEQFESLKASNISEANKAVIEVLYREIGYLGEIVEFGLFNSSGKTGTHYTDAVSGESIPYPEIESPFDVFYDYQPVALTHFDSALICATGKYTDSGVKCD